VRLLGDLPLKPMVVDRWVGRLRTLAHELAGLQRRSSPRPTRGRRPSCGSAAARSRRSSVWPRSEPWPSCATWTRANSRCGTPRRP
jgi:hypothetical protein